METQAIRQQLEQLRLELSERLDKIATDLRSGRSRDLEDQAQERENDDVMEALSAEATEELKAVDKALSRLDQGEYGLCVKCGEAIAEKRLQAYPAAEYCIDCAERLAG